MAQLTKLLMRKSPFLSGRHNMLTNIARPICTSNRISIDNTKPPANTLFQRNSVQKCGLLITDNTRKMCTKNKVNYKFRRMEDQDLPKIFKILHEEGWIMEKAYLECAFDTDPSGFIVAVSDDGEILGSHGFLAHAGKVATMGLWMVRKEYRYLNIGVQLYAYLRTLTGDVNLGTFVWPYYEEKIREDFLPEPFITYMTWYNYGIANPKAFKRSKKEDFEIVPAKDVPLDDLLGYDTTIHTLPREEYMKRWLQHENSKTYVAVRSNKVVGYGVLRTQDHYNQIAPLYANDKSVASALFNVLTSEVPQNAKIGFSSPFQNSAATEMAAVSGMLKPCIPLIMFYEKEPVVIDTRKVYAVSSNSFCIC